MGNDFSRHDAWRDELTYQILTTTTFTDLAHHIAHSTSNLTGFYDPSQPPPPQNDSPQGLLYAKQASQNEQACRRDFFRTYIPLIAALSREPELLFLAHLIRHGCAVNTFASCLSLLQTARIAASAANSPINSDLPTSASTSSLGLPPPSGISSPPTGSVASTVCPALSASSLHVHPVFRYPQLSKFNSLPRLPYGFHPSRPNASNSASTGIADSKSTNHNQNNPAATTSSSDGSALSSLQLEPIAHSIFTRWFTAHKPMLHALPRSYHGAILFANPLYAAFSKFPRGRELSCIFTTSPHMYQSILTLQPASLPRTEQTAARSMWNNYLLFMLLGAGADVWNTPLMPPSDVLNIIPPLAPSPHHYFFESSVPASLLTSLTQTTGTSSSLVSLPPPVPSSSKSSNIQTTSPKPLVQHHLHHLYPHTLAPAAGLLLPGQLITFPQDDLAMHSQQALCFSFLPRLNVSAAPHPPISGALPPPMTVTSPTAAAAAAAAGATSPHHNTTLSTSTPFPLQQHARGSVRARTGSTVMSFTPVSQTSPQNPPVQQPEDPVVLDLYHRRDASSPDRPASRSVSRHGAAGVSNTQATINASSRRGGATTISSSHQDAPHQDISTILRVVDPNDETVQMPVHQPHYHFLHAFSESNLFTVQVYKDYRLTPNNGFCNVVLALTQHPNDQFVTKLYAGKTPPSFHLATSSADALANKKKIDRFLLSHYKWAKYLDISGASQIDNILWYILDNVSPEPFLTYSNLDMVCDLFTMNPTMIKQLNHFEQNIFFLLENGTSINVSQVNHNGSTILHQAILRQWSPYLIMTLYKYIERMHTPSSASSSSTSMNISSEYSIINHQDNFGRTPLMLLLCNPFNHMFYRKIILEMLTDPQLDPTLCDFSINYNNWTVLQQAQDYAYWEVQRRLTLEDPYFDKSGHLLLSAFTKEQLPYVFQRLYQEWQEQSEAQLLYEGLMRIEGKGLHKNNTSEYELNLDRDKNTTRAQHVAAAAATTAADPVNTESIPEPPHPLAASKLDIDFSPYALPESFIASDLIVGGTSLPIAHLSNESPSPSLPSSPSISSVASTLPSLPPNSPPQLRPMSSFGSLSISSGFSALDSPLLASRREFFPLSPATGPSSANPASRRLTLGVTPSSGSFYPSFPSPPPAERLSFGPTSSSVVLPPSLPLPAAPVESPIPTPHNAHTPTQSSPSASNSPSASPVLTPNSFVGSFTKDYVNILSPHSSATQSAYEDLVSTSEFDPLSSMLLGGGPLYFELETPTHDTSDHHHKDAIPPPPVTAATTRKKRLSAMTTSPQFRQAAAAAATLQLPPNLPLPPTPLNGSPANGLSPRRGQISSRHGAVSGTTLASQVPPPPPLDDDDDDDFFPIGSATKLSTPTTRGAKASSFTRVTAVVGVRSTATGGGISVTSGSASRTNGRAGSLSTSHQPDASKPLTRRVNSSVVESQHAPPPPPPADDDDLLDDFTPIAPTGATSTTLIAKARQGSASVGGFGKASVTARPVVVSAASARPTAPMSMTIKPALQLSLNHSTSVSRPSPHTPSSWRQPDGPAHSEQDIFNFRDCFLAKTIDYCREHLTSLNNMTIFHYFFRSQMDFILSTDYNNNNLRQPTSYQTQYDYLTTQQEIFRQPCHENNPLDFGIVQALHHLYNKSYQQAKTTMPSYLAHFHNQLQQTRHSLAARPTGNPFSSRGSLSEHKIPSNTHHHHHHHHQSTLQQQQHAIQSVKPMINCLRIAQFGCEHFFRIEDHYGFTIERYWKLFFGVDIQQPLPPPS